ncbi:TlpA disulfide reductase family protein [Chitinophaga sp. Cy-1792]|uniref:TlpA family protein disulfide reductase n=1 Tax=Chitinophaga sp. Cy-1792 TaxID=2608339 RepID=UPI001423A11B|nr:TlpA disulfide reductase family protein [Chitinophaga sp. Cy-1792]NIG55024.1 TlpA family protein disulfide reductase [Chitinophaga sp. Cy-1792]
MKAIRFFLFLLLCHQANAATPPVTTLHVKVNTSPVFSGMISFSSLDSKSNQCKSEIFFIEKDKPVVIFSKTLAATTQVITLNRCPLLTNAGDQVNLELRPLYKGTEIVQGRYVAACSGKDAARQLLPYLIDSLYTNADLSKINTIDQANEFITATAALIAKKTCAAKINQAENLAVLTAFEQEKQLLFKFNFLDAHKDLPRTKELGNWYMQGYDFSAPGLTAFGDDDIARQAVYLWYHGRKLQDSTLTEASMLQELLFACKADRIKETEAINWLQTEGKERAFTPDMKITYPVIKSALKPNTPAVHTADSLYKSYQQMEPGMPAFNFALENDLGKFVRLSDFKGKIVIIDFWAMWCPSCVASLPNLKQLEATYKDKNDIVFLTVAWEDASSANRAKLKQFSIDHHIDGENNLFLNFDRNDPAAKKIVEHYCLTGITRWVAIDQEGNIMNGNIGHPLRPGFEQRIANIYQQRN